MLHNRTCLATDRFELPSFREPPRGVGRCLTHLPSFRGVYTPESRKLRLVDVRGWVSVRELPFP